jgi:Gluconate 2-dehydrogenase subunit 3
VAINSQPVKLTDLNRFTAPPRSNRLRRLVDAASYIPQALNRPQFTILLALLKRMIPQLEANPIHLAAQLDATLANAVDHSLTPPPLPCNYILALDELDNVARARTGYAFADLTPEIQDAMLSLIATHDITTRRLDLGLWLNDLRRTAASCLPPPR